MTHQNAQNGVGDTFTMVKIPFLAVVTGRKIDLLQNELFKGDNRYVLMSPTKTLV